MKIVIIGSGKVGSAIAKELSGENHDIVIIDKSQDVVDNMVSELDILGVCGNGVIASDQREAGVTKADLVMAVTKSDETNVICCLVAKALGAKHTIARVRDPGFSVQSEFMRNKLGIDLLVNPENEAAEEIARHLRYPNAEHVDCFCRGKADLVAVRVTEKSPIADMALRQLYSKMKIKLLICAVERKGEIIIPDGNTVFVPGDLAYFTGVYQSVDALFHKLGMSSLHVRSLLIIGGGRITHYLARLLIESGMKVKIIELDRTKCEQLSDALPKATVVCGDGADKQLLIEEGIDLVDSFVTLTGNDEENIILSLYAKSRGVDKVITKVNSEFFAELLGTLDLGTVISPKAVMSEQIVKFTRSMQAPDGSSVLALYKIIDDKAEALEFAVNGNPEFVGKTVRDIRFKPGVLIASIMRGREFIVPDGSASIEPDDELLVISSKYKFTQLEDILA